MEENGVRPIDAMLDSLHRRTNNYVNMFGPEILKDKAFLKAKRNGLENIRRSFDGTKNKDDLATLKIINNQIRKLNREIYPRFGIGRAINTVRTINIISKKMFDLAAASARKIAKRRQARSDTQQMDKIISDLNGNKDKKVKSENTKRIDLKRRHANRIILSGGISNGKKL
ncbi:hypothetical protein [Chitinophaga eiseniae]|uniref:Uncharacterized protein n=1 Tax=Chitinophaga eiseniae TaxID=634771 RepID=A0A847SLJ7_9BACT|nr:hypothetical protein [Chitinophaga eiseniae]NLR78019.1 hypothetical protein [Chitinophaga eiseniae]